MESFILDGIVKDLTETNLFWLHSFVLNKIVQKSSYITMKLILLAIKVII